MADFLGLLAVHQQLQGLGGEGIGFLLDVILQPQQAFLAGDVAPFDDFFDGGLHGDGGRHKGPFGPAERPLEHIHRHLNQNRANGAADHDEERRAIDQRTDVAAFDQHAADDATKRNDQASKG